MVISASHIRVERDDEDYPSLSVTLSFNTGPQQRYFMLQRALRPTDHDISLGHDLPYLELDDQSRSCYTKPLRVSWSSGQVDILLDDAGAKRLGCDDHVVIVTQGHEELGGLLRQILAR